MKFAATYAQHLQWIDRLTADVLRHAPPLSKATEEFRAELAGLLSISYVAAFESSIKAIMTSFATSKHKVLGNVAGFHFNRINGRVKISNIIDTYTVQFGEVYKKEFQDLIALEEEKTLRLEKTSLKETYNNVIMWRNAFAHEGTKLTTLEEVSGALPIARRVIIQLDKAMSS